MHAYITTVHCQIVDLSCVFAAKLFLVHFIFKLFFFEVVICKLIMVLYFITDYFRVIFAFASFYYMPTEPVIASVLYIVSGLLDAIDGHLARMLNQGM